MAARSTFTRTSGSVITSAWANSLRDHVVPFTGADDVTTEGQIGVNTITDRLVIHDGTASRRLGHYTSSGRTGFSYTSSANPIGPGLTAQIAFTTATFDSDGFYTGWNGTVYTFTVPASLPGVYAITVNVFSSVTITSGGMGVAVTTSGLTYAGYTTPNTNWASTALIVPFVASQTLSVAVENRHSASSNFDVRIFGFRLFA
jgi:hypothetical protein